MRKVINIFLQYKDKALHCYFILMSSFWIGAVLYFRFIYERSPYELSHLKGTTTLTSFSLHMTFILSHIILITYAIYSIIKKDNQGFTGIWTQVMDIIKYVFHVLIVNPLTYVRNILSPIIPYSGQVFCYFGDFIRQKPIWVSNSFVIFFNTLPRIFVSLVFFTEIVFYERIYYFIPSLFLLVIPILWFIFLSFFIEFGLHGIADIPTYVKIIPVGEHMPNGWYKSYTCEPYDHLDYTECSPFEYTKLYVLSIDIYNHGVLYLKGFQEKIVPYVTLFVSSIYVLVTIYKILLII